MFCRSELYSRFWYYSHSNFNCSNFYDLLHRMIRMWFKWVGFVFLWVSNTSILVYIFINEYCILLVLFNMVINSTSRKRPWVYNIEGENIKGPTHYVKSHEPLFESLVRKKGNLEQQYYSPDAKNPKSEDSLLAPTERQIHIFIQSS